MRAALALARRGLGRVAPNPAVGCVLVKDGRVIGRGWTQPGGRPHAETEALGAAVAQAHGDEKITVGATLYVTLEPCSHHGKTPPCADALVRAGIGRCVVSLEDPDPRVSGRGLQRLRDAGIQVEVGLLAEQARELNAGYLLRQSAGRPSVALKLATSLDGKIAARTGDSRWVTGEAARAHGHLLRAGHDAIMIGSGTALADDPRLDVRLPGLEGASPLRVVLDGRLRVPPSHDLVARAARQPTVLMTRHDCDEARLAPFREAGVELQRVAAGPQGGVSLDDCLTALGGRGVTRVLVEGGGSLAASLLKQNLVERLFWYRSSIVVGSDGLPAVGELGVTRMADSLGFRSRGSRRLGKDLLEVFVRSHQEH